MKKQDDYLQHRHLFVKDHSDVPLYLVTLYPQGRLRKRMHLELMRFLFNEEMKVVQLGEGTIGCLSLDDQHRLFTWSMDMGELGGLNDTSLPDFNKMYGDIRDDQLRIAKFDIFYGLVEPQPNQPPSDEFVNFYTAVMNSMTKRFYCVKQSFGDVNFLDPNDAHVWMFYFEDENDHLVFSNLVDMEIAANTGLFRAPPKPKVIFDYKLGGVGGISSTYAGISFSSSTTKAKLRAKMTQHPDGTVTLEEI